MSANSISSRNPSPSAGIQIIYKLTVPPNIVLPVDPSQALQEKLRKVPSENRDKLHPSETEPFVEYVDEGIWKNRITFHKDPSHAVQQSKEKAAASAAFADLDSLCESEMQRRYPNYTVIQGVKATLKNIFPNLYRTIVGTTRFFQEFTQKEVNKYKTQIAYSAFNCDDLKSCPKIEDPTLRKELRLTSDSILETDHIFPKNSPLNGQSFLLDGRTVHLSQAIASPNDRKVENTGNLRLVQSKDKESICYTGRADSDRKALEQASFIFLNELKTKGKGISSTVDQHGNITYQLDYVANSLLSTPWLWKMESLIAPFPERQYLDNERKAFKKLKSSGPVTIEDPNCPGRTYKVQFNPILFSRSLNVFNWLENWLPSFMTGMRHSIKVSDEGWTELQSVAQQKLSAMRAKLTQPIPADHRQELEQKIKAIETSLKTLQEHHDQYHLRPEQELIVRDYLCKLLGLPIIYHCKSSTDRTSITNAMSQSLKQWIDLKLPIPENVIPLFEDYRFKELFAANWMAGHQITRYARGGVGTVAGQKMNDKNLGLEMNRGIPQNPVVAHVVPERYLKDLPMSQKIKMTALYLLLILPLVIIMYLPLFYFNSTARYLADLFKTPSVAGPSKSPKSTKLFFDFMNFFPDKVLNESSPQIGARKLLAGGKNGGQKDDK